MTTDTSPSVAEGGRRGVAAFDFDGTLVPGDSLGPFLLRLLGRRRALASAASSGPAMVGAYRRDGRDGAKAALLQRAVAGIGISVAREAGHDFGRHLSERVRPRMAERLRWHRSEGHRLVLVSASLAMYLEPFGAEAGFDHVIATGLEVGADGRLTGRLEGTNVRGPEKARRLQSLIGGAAVELWAYGDSAGDAEMLRMADHPVRVGRRLAD